MTKVCIAIFLLAFSAAAVAEYAGIPITGPWHRVAIWLGVQSVSN